MNTCTPFTFFSLIMHNNNKLSLMYKRNTDAHTHIKTKPHEDEKYLLHSKSFIIQRNNKKYNNNNITSKNINMKEHEYQLFFFLAFCLYYNTNIHHLLHQNTRNDSRDLHYISLFRMYSIEKLHIFHLFLFPFFSIHIE